MEHNHQMQAQLKLFTAADVEPKEVSWLWYPYIPFGKVSLMHGDSGDGKSTFALNLAALLTRGDTLPFSPQCHGPMNVIYINMHGKMNLPSCGKEYFLQPVSRFFFVR